MKTKMRLLLLMLAAALWPWRAQAEVKGDFTDPGGGKYWAHVWMSSSSNNSSYKDLTGQDEDEAMNNLRGFESSNNAVISVVNPTVTFKFRYHNKNVPKISYSSSSQEFWVKKNDGTFVKVGSIAVGSWDMVQDNKQYGEISLESHDDEWITVRFVPSAACKTDVREFHVENRTDYKVSKKKLSVRSSYHKVLEYSTPEPREAKVEWVAPGKVKITGDNTWLPDKIGNYTEDYHFVSWYYCSVKYPNGSVGNVANLLVGNQETNSVELKVPDNIDFSIQIIRWTQINFKYNGTEFLETSSVKLSTENHFYNSPVEVKASFNQVKGEMRLQWDVSEDVLKQGDYKVCRTTMNENGTYSGNREQIGSTSDKYFVDNTDRALEYGKYYRYEVFQQMNSWEDITLPTDPEKSGAVVVNEVKTNTMPVVPLQLVQDSTASENITFNWDFGNIPDYENDITFKVNRIEPNGTITRNYIEVTVPRTAGKASFTDDKPESNCTIYGYYLQLGLIDNRITICSDTVYGHVYAGTTIKTLLASKATSGNNVKLTWSVNQVGTENTLFEIQRRYVGGTEWSVIHQVEGTGSQYSYTDENVEVGRYYEYRVIAYGPDCEGGGHVINNAMTALGYGQATGVISGRVQFEGGSAVDGVRINLSRESDEKVRSPFYSRHILTDGEGIMWNTDKKTANQLLRLDQPFTIQTWINPAKGEESIGLFKIAGYDDYHFYLNHYTDGKDGYVLAMGKSGSTIGGSEQWFVDSEGTPEVIEPDVFTHVTIRNNGNGKLDCIINGKADILRTNAQSGLSYSEISGTDGKVIVNFFGPRADSGDGIANSFKGYADEVRLWSRALTNNEVANTYNRILNGREDGLKLYWTFDEGLEEYAFDNSYTDGVPNDNHPEIGNNSRPSDIVPTDDQLSIYGVTNQMGEYEIRGIPFSGSGTRYSVIPTKGTHDFNPSSRSAFVSASALTINNTDFTDVSSFRVRGTVRYDGTTIPVDSVTFYIDGIPCNKNDDFIFSDENGEYEISVPIGKHYIEARRNGHTFVDDGRYPANQQATYDFVEETNIDFKDNTLVVFAGRVTGGSTEAEKPLGYGQSKNNIGQAVVKISALDHPQRMMNAVDTIVGITREWIPNPVQVEAPSTSAKIKSTSYRAGGDIDEAKYIYIKTDPATGEFCAKVPPLRYKVESVRLPNNTAVERDEVFSSVFAVDITNPSDTVLPDTAYNINNEPLPLFRCNKKLMLTYRAQPIMEINQIGAKPGAFGTDTITVQGTDFNDYKLALYTYDENTGNVTYNYNYPVFQQGRTYEFKVKAYEPYTNYDAKPEGVLYRDLLRDTVITFDNELGAMAKVVAADTTNSEWSYKRGEVFELEEGQILLDSIGEGTYKWQAGIPSLTAPYTRSMNASMIINGQPKLWRNEGLRGVIFGVVPTGNNFVTAGPDRVQMVLRDPPGDASSATWGTDTIKTRYSYRTEGFHNSGGVGATYKAGVGINVAEGTPVFLNLQYDEIIHDNNFYWNYELKTTHDNRTYTTYINFHEISTSSSPYYVGRDGDVFVGYSTNYIVGAADKVGLQQQTDGTWTIGMNETVCVDEKFNTHFEYSQKYIENSLIPNLKRIRNSKLTTVKTLEEMLDNPPVVTYYTLLDENDPKYGSPNDDKTVWGDLAQEGSDGPSYYFRLPENIQCGDSVMWCNEIIKAWKKTLSDNEEDKLNAFDATEWKVGNESFESGTTATTSTIASKHEQHNFSFDFTFSFGVKLEHGVQHNKMTGLTFQLHEDAGYHYSVNDVKETTTESKFSYTLNDTQAGNAHTVDIFKSPMGWGPIFRTRGGQTRCPYEDETQTKYFKPGTLLDYATMKSDNPKIDMDVRSVTGIPAGQEAQLQVVFKNESETHDKYTVATVYVDAESNPNGLQVFMDGEPLVNGTEVWMEYGVPLIKTITIKQSDQSILNYNNIRLVLHSSCMALSPYDQVEFSANFVPAAPPVTLALNKTVLNKRATEGNDPVIATIKDINRQFNGLKGVRLKYRFVGDDQWITAHEWFTKTEYLPEGKVDNTHSMLPDDNPNIIYTLDLPNIDGHYLVQAESFSVFESKEVANATNEIEVVCDTRGPKLLGQAYPNTGFFRPTDDIHIRFNEDIRESYLTKDGNFVITGVLNDAPINHEVSLQLNGNALKTDATLPLYNTDFSTSFWIKRQSGGKILEHGTDDSYFAIELNETGNLAFDVNGTKVETTTSIPANKWIFVGLNYYNGDTPHVDAFYAEDAATTMLLDNATVPKYNGDAVISIGDQLHAAISNLSFWKKTASQAEILENKNKNFPAYTPGLIGYWKMNEGHGTVVTDYARSRHFNLPSEMWNIDNTNYAAHFDGTHVLKSDISTLDARSTDSFMFELWFRGEKGKNNGATLMSVTDAFAVEFTENGQLVLNTFDPLSMPSTTTAGTPHLLSSVDYNDGNWHHFALNVHRGVSAVAYVDGDAVKTLAEQDVPAPAGDFLHVGSKLVETDKVTTDGHLFTGDIDELRLWSGAYDGTTIRNYRYSMVDTADASGLFAYYPMQMARLDGAGNVLTEFSALNKLDNRSSRDVATGLKAAMTAPAIKSAPDATNIHFNYTASKDEIYIDLNELPSRLHGNLINFRVKNVRDIHDNLSENIAWGAIVDYNSLRWNTEKTDVTKTRLYEAPITNSLINISSEPTSFTISDVPSWLTVTPTSGSIGVGETQQINFVVTMGAPVGKHQVIVYAKNNEDIYTPYIITVDVTGNQPDWHVNPNQYESTMNIVGQIYVNDKIAQEKNTKIAAFVGDECRGVASPKYISTRDAYFVNLTVYGHEGVTTDEPIEFRIYDASQGVVITDISTIVDGTDKTISFKPNDLVGNYNQPVAWMAGSSIDQAIALKEGWSWISLYVNPYSPTLEGIFGHDRAYKNVTSKSDGFGECDGTQWQSSLASMKPGDMYKVRVTKDVTAHAKGLRIDTKNTPYTMYKGWNWIGPLSIYNLTLAEAFADLNPAPGDVVKSKDKVSIYNGFQWEGVLDALIPGDGYYYFSNDDSDKTFHYPDIEGRQLSPMLKTGQNVLAYKPLDHHQFSDNMNVIAYLHRADNPYTGGTLGAFIDGECRGAVNASGDLYFLTIAGNADEQGKKIELRAMIDGRDQVVDNALTFLTDVIVGSLDEPYDIDLSSSAVDDLATSGARITVTPTITSDAVNVDCPAGLRSVKVYDSMGRLVERSGELSGGVTHVTIHLSSQPCGVYLIDITAETGNRRIQKVARN